MGDCPAQCRAEGRRASTPAPRLCSSGYHGLDVRAPAACGDRLGFSEGVRCHGQAARDCDDSPPGRVPGRGRRRPRGAAGKLFAPEGVGAGGYDPVAQFTQGRAAPGSPEFGRAWRGDQLLRQRRASQRLRCGAGALPAAIWRVLRRCRRERFASPQPTRRRSRSSEASFLSITARISAGADRPVPAPISPRTGIGRGSGWSSERRIPVALDALRADMIRLAAGGTGQGGWGIVHGPFAG